MAYEGSDGFDIGRVISRAFGVMGANFTLFAALALLLVGAPNLALGVWRSRSGFDEALAAGGAMNAEAGFPTEFWGMFAAWTGIAVAVTLVAGTILQTALTRASIRSLSGRRPGLGDSLAIGIRLFIPVLIIAVLMWLGLILAAAVVIIPLAFLIGISAMAIGPLAAVLGIVVPFLALVPIVYLYLVWCIAIPAFVSEKIGIFDAFGRSRELTKGSRLRIFVVLLVLAVATWTLSFGIGMVAAAALAAAPLAVVAITALVTALSSMASTAIHASIYFELRETREGATAGDLEAIFA